MGSYQFFKDELKKSGLSQSTVSGEGLNKKNKVKLLFKRFILFYFFLERQTSDLGGGIPNFLEVFLDSFSSTHSFNSIPKKIMIAGPDNETLFV